MDRFARIFAFVVFAIALSFAAVACHAQDIKPVTGGGGGAGIILILIGAALVGGFVFLKKRRPDIFAAKVQPALTDVEHTIKLAVPKVFEQAKNAVQGISGKLHDFAATKAQVVAPAVALPPSAYVPAPYAPVPGVPPLTTEQFMSDEPLPVDPQSAPAAGPRIVNGRVVL